MPTWKQASATAATTAPSSADGTRAKPDVSPSSLLMMTTLGAVDGTIVLLAANGVLSTLAGALVTGLMVMAGAGAWIVARQVYGGRRRTGRDRLVLASIAVTTSLATVAAAWLGDWAGQSIRFHVLPRAVGLVLLLVAMEVGGLRLPRVPHLRNVPLPVLALAIAGIAEGVAQWTL